MKGAIKSDNRKQIKYKNKMWKNFKENNKEKKWHKQKPWNRTVEICINIAVAIIMGLSSPVKKQWLSRGLFHKRKFVNVLFTLGASEIQTQKGQN